jgi:hypothetical protein
LLVFHDTQPQFPFGFEWNALATLPRKKISSTSTTAIFDARASKIRHDFIVFNLFLKINSADTKLNLVTRSLHPRNLGRIYNLGRVVATGKRALGLKKKKLKLAASAPALSAGRDE